jgi:hypothetical protein
MMRAEIAQEIQKLLAATGQFKAVLGLGSDKPEYPLARVWVSGGLKDANIENRPEAFIDLRVVLQIEIWLAKDDDGNSIDGPIYDLVDVSFNALHGKKLPGKGSQHLIVYDFPGLIEYKSDAPAVYTIQVSARVLPKQFSLT